MKKIISSIFGLFILHVLPAQFVAKMEVKGPLPGACDSTNVCVLFSGFKGQVEPVASITKKEIQARLQSEVSFLKDNPKFKGHLMVRCIVNCKGDLIQCEIDTKSGNDELDSQVVKIFSSLTKWTPGTLNGNAIDCVMLFSMDVKKGEITLS